MGQIALKDGTGFDNSVLAETPSDHSILLTIPKKDIVECAILFGNPENTEKIAYTDNFFTTVYTGYTALKGITNDPNSDSTLIRLGVDGEVSKIVEYAVPEEYVPEPLRLPKDQ